MADPEYTTDKVLAALTDQWMASRAIHRIIDQGSEITVSHILTKLAAHGLIDRDLKPYQGGTIAMYRRRQHANPA